MKLHVEVTLLAPATAIVKKRKRTLRGAAWAVYEGKELRCMGRVDDDPKGFIATSAGRMFAASLHLAHGKLVDANSIEATVGDGTKPKAQTKAANGAPKAKKGKTAAAQADDATTDGEPATVETNGATEAAPKAKKGKAAKGKAAKAAEPVGAAPASEPTEAAPVASDQAPAKAPKQSKSKPAKKSKKSAEAAAE
jgi:hypothetical protein